MRRGAEREVYRGLGRGILGVVGRGLLDDDTVWASEELRSRRSRDLVRDHAKHLLLGSVGDDSHGLG